MQGILYDASRIKVCQGFYDICEYAEFDKEWTDKLWTDIITCRDIYEELVYYIEHHTFMDKIKVRGYSLSDIYVWQMDKYNLVREIGKNPRTCNKERMVMRAFRTMIDMQRHPDEYVRRLEEGRGEDKL
ncbi:MAG: hypothetical protein J6C64_07900 [Lachnospiraceae bacterium]|nr:hypothetical protein [Lachnospiraceae bacterium]